jgi:hypothetical protein
MNTASFFALALLVTPCAIADAAAPHGVAEKQIRAALKVWAPDLIGWAPRRCRRNEQAINMRIVSYPTMSSNSVPRVSWTILSTKKIEMNAQAA